MSIFLPSYAEPRKVPTNTRWCPYARVAHARAKHLLQVVPRFRLLLDAPRHFHYRASGGNAVGLVLSGTRWRCDTNLVIMVSQDSRLTRYNYNGSRKSQVVVWFI
jgi:hypothetical protein